MACAFVCGILFFLSGCSAQHRDDFPWEQDYQTAIQESQKSGKPLFIMMTADWCGPCKKLERDTLSDPKVRDFMKAFVSVKAYEDEKVEKKYGYNGYPTLVIADKKGEKVYKFSGYMPPGPFIKEISNAYKELGLKLPK